MVEMGVGGDLRVRVQVRGLVEGASANIRVRLPVQVQVQVQVHGNAPVRIQPEAKSQCCT